MNYLKSAWDVICDTFDSSVILVGKYPMVATIVVLVLVGLLVFSSCS